MNMNNNGKSNYDGSIVSNSFNLVNVIQIPLQSPSSSQLEVPILNNDY